MRLRCWIRLAVSKFGLVVLFLCFATAGFSQTEAATVRGSVTDSTGAFVPGAVIRLIDIDRGTKSEVTSQRTGFYSFPSVTQAAIAWKWKGAASSSFT